MICVRFIVKPGDYDERLVVATYGDGRMPDDPRHARHTVAIAKTPVAAADPRLRAG